MGLFYLQSNLTEPSSSQLLPLASGLSQHVSMMAFEEKSTADHKSEGGMRSSSYPFYSSRTEVLAESVLSPSRTPLSGHARISLECTEVMDEENPDYDASPLRYASGRAGSLDKTPFPDHIFDLDGIHHVEVDTGLSYSFACSFVLLTGVTSQTCCGG